MRHDHGRVITESAALSLLSLGLYHGGSIACTLDARPFRTTGGFNLAERLPWLKPQSADRIHNRSARWSWISRRVPTEQMPSRTMSTSALSEDPTSGKLHLCHFRASPTMTATDCMFCFESGAGCRSHEFGQLDRLTPACWRLHWNAAACFTIAVGALRW